jgi:molybdate/tungstate transport system substrate-binding protein
MGAALDSFKVATGTEYAVTAAGSLDLARRITDLGQTVDIIALADREVFPQLLMPDHLTWFADFARNRMVLARQPGLETAGDRWWQTLESRQAIVGRSDPDLDPGGYRALMVFQLAERHYNIPALASRLLATSPAANIRPKSAELVALLQAGEFSHAWLYESSARAAGLPFDTLPAAIDLGSAADSAGYAGVDVRVGGAGRGDTITVRGAPIRYAISIPNRAEHRELAERFVSWLLGPGGQRVLRREYLDAIDRPAFTGTGVPAALMDPARTSP